MVAVVVEEELVLNQVMQGVVNSGGTANGGGGPAGANPSTAGAGGSGIVIIRYKFQ